MDLQRNTIFLQREAVLKLDIFLRKVKLCFIKKLNKKNNSLMYQHCTTAWTWRLCLQTGKSPFVHSQPTFCWTSYI